MDFKLIWTERALSDLAEVVRHFREDEKSIEAARKVGSAIIEQVEVLQTLPDIGPRYPRKKWSSPRGPLLRLPDFSTASIMRHVWSVCPQW